MTVDVYKVVGGIALGPPEDRVVVYKVVGAIIYDPNTAAPTAPQVRKKVDCAPQIIHTAT